MLYLVATPIGNLDDMTHRAVKILSTVDRILAEDTRHSRKLLDHYQITTPMTAYHEHNEADVTPGLIRELERGKHFALISDAGTPLISDPGFDLIRMARAKGIEVSPIPGPCAAIAALSAAGLPTDTFTFAGFLPHKTVARQTRLSTLKALGTTVVLYESPHRLLDALADIQTVFGPGHSLVVAKEISKQFERFLTGTVEQVRQTFEADAALRQGEFVLLLAAAETAESGRVDCPVDQVLADLAAVLPKSKAAELVATWTGQPKRALYQRLLG